MEPLSFSKSEVERSFRKFNDVLQDIMQANHSTWETCLAHLMAHCEKNKVMRIVTEALRLNDHVDLDGWLKQIFSDRTVSLPVDDEEQIALLYKLFSRIDEKQLQVWDIGIGVFGDGNLDVIVSEFNTQFIYRFGREVAYRLDEVLERSADKREVSREALVVFQETHPMSEPDNTHVFVVHGRNEKARTALFTFLRAIGLRPLEWTESVEATGQGAPYIGEILDAAFSKAQAVVVLITPDDEARLQQHLRQQNEPAYEAELTPQARPNVIFEAGMALGRNPVRTILVELGELRPFSDVAGRHVIRMNDSSEIRQALAMRLKTAGCAVNLNGTDWHRAGEFNLSVAVAQPHPRAGPVEGVQPQQSKPPPLVTDVVAVNMLKTIGVQANQGMKLVNAGLMTRDELVASLDTYVDVYFYDPRIHGLDPTRVDLEATTVPINTITGEIG